MKEEKAKSGIKALVRVYKRERLRVIYKYVFLRKNELTAMSP